MLVLDRATGAIEDKTFRDLPAMLGPGDLLVLNDSRVIPARLFATRAGAASQKQKPTGQQPTGKIEVLLTQQLDPHEWSALVRPGKKVQPGERLFFSAQDNAPPLLEAEVIARGEFGERTLRFTPTADFYGALEAIGHMPLPPYMHREDTLEDRERYQTVFAHHTR